MIDNTKELEQFIDLDDSGIFYKFEAIIRNTDGPNPITILRQKDNLLIKSWFVDNKTYLNKVLPEMKAICDVTGARLYMTCDRKTIKNLVNTLFTKISDIIKNLLNNTQYSARTLHHLFNSCTSLVNSSEHSHKTIMFDVDTNDEQIKEAVVKYIEQNKQTPYIFNSKKGYHIVCFKKFNSTNWKEDMAKLITPSITQSNEEWNEGTKHVFIEKVEANISMQDNALLLVYHPEKDWN